MSGRPQLSLFAPPPAPVIVARPVIPTPVVVVTTNRYRLVRNAAIEVYVKGKADPFAPWFDVEGIDSRGMPACVIAVGVDAPTAREIIAAAGGIEVGY